MMLESTWDAVISEPGDLAVDAYVCFAHLPATGSERVVITNEDDWQTDDDEVPAAAAQAGMTACMARGDLVQIVANAMAQDPGVPQDVLRRAVRYYFDNDAFLNLDANG